MKKNLQRFCGVKLDYQLKEEIDEVTIMGGKAAILLVLGFSLIFIVAGNNFNRLAYNSTDNSADYYDLQILNNISNSGINLAISSLRRDKNWKPDSSGGKDNADFTFGGGNFNLRLQKLGNFNVLTATAKFKDRTKIVETKLKMPKFSEYAYFSDQESSKGKIWWYDTDTVWGPFHTNDDLNCAYKPWFLGNSTTYGGKLNLYGKSHKKHAPHIAGHYEKKTIDFPLTGISELATKAADDGHVFSGHSKVFLEFAGDSIRYKFNKNDPYTTKLASALSPNKTIYAKNAELHIKGTVSGNWSVGCSGKAGYNKYGKTTGAGNVLIDDDIVYKDKIDFFEKNDPSNDLLGILAQQNVLISDNNSTKNINIHGAIYCEEGGFGSDNYAKRSADGTIYLKGGITQKIRRPVGTFSKYGIASGFSKNYRYDARLERISPPSFPETGQFVVVSWLDTMLPE